MLLLLIKKGDKMPIVKMSLSGKGYKNFKSVMKKMGFADQNLFLRFCILKAIKPKLTKREKAAADKEIKLIKERQKKK